MLDIVKIGCLFCGWTGKRADAELKRNRLVRCPRCSSLTTSEDAREAGRRSQTFTLLQMPDRPFGDF